MCGGWNQLFECWIWSSFFSVGDWSSIELILDRRERAIPHNSTHSLEGTNKTRCVHLSRARACWYRRDGRVVSPSLERLEHNTVTQQQQHGIQQEQQRYQQQEQQVSAMVSFHNSLAMASSCRQGCRASRFGGHGR